MQSTVRFVIRSFMVAGMILFLARLLEMATS